jgi:hypothetical protein
LSDEKKNAIANEIKELLEGYHQAAIRKDTEWFRNFWANEENFAAALDGDLATEYGSWFQTSYVEALPTIKEILHFEFTNSKAAVISENAVSYATNFDWGMITTADDTIKSKGSIVYVFIRKNGKWQCIQTGGTHKYY